MKKYAFFALFVILVTMGGCRASDCGCPMSENHVEGLQNGSYSGFSKT